MMIFPVRPKKNVIGMIIYSCLGIGGKDGLEISIKSWLILQPTSVDYGSKQFWD